MRNDIIYGLALLGGQGQLAYGSIVSTSSSPSHIQPSPSTATPESIPSFSPLPLLPPLIPVPDDLLNDDDAAVKGPWVQFANDGVESHDGDDYDEYDDLGQDGPSLYALARRGDPTENKNIGKPGNRPTYPNAKDAYNSASDWYSPWSHALPGAWKIFVPLIGKTIHSNDKLPNTYPEGRRYGDIGSKIAADGGHWLGPVHQILDEKAGDLPRDFPEHQEVDWEGYHKNEKRKMKARMECNKRCRFKCAPGITDGLPTAAAAAINATLPGASLMYTLYKKIWYIWSPSKDCRGACLEYCEYAGGLMQFDYDRYFGLYTLVQQARPRVSQYELDKQERARRQEQKQREMQDRIREERVRQGKKVRPRPDYNNNKSGKYDDRWDEEDQQFEDTRRGHKNTKMAQSSNREKSGHYDFDGYED
ncbi:hypothetical protein QBC35DRAFT_448834 [Podospora australis]|uniref:Uncharacterized protein n=1 Tax=Podospora australis TaxID=1536484 RepID=A0AAN6WZ59_9PEZI|nr:hypothetical protein QBC35DRAFT_448834 [Podospora australis]